MSESGEGIKFREDGPTRLLVMRVTRKRDYLWGADVFLGRVPLIKLHFAVLVAILVGVWR